MNGKKRRVFFQLGGKHEEKKRSEKNEDAEEGAGVGLRLAVVVVS